MKRYEYMVVYSHGGGTGRVRIEKSSKVASYADIEELDALILKHSGMTVCVTDFKLLRVYEDKLLK